MGARGEIWWHEDFASKVVLIHASRSAAARACAVGGGRVGVEWGKARDCSLDVQYGIKGQGAARIVGLVMAHWRIGAWRTALARYEVGRVGRSA